MLIYKHTWTAEFLKHGLEAHGQGALVQNVVEGRARGAGGRQEAVSRLVRLLAVAVHRGQLVVDGNLTIKQVELHTKLHT